MAKCVLAAFARRIDFLVYFLFYHGRSDCKVLCKRAGPSARKIFGVVKLNALLIFTNPTDLAGVQARSLLNAARLSD